MVDVEIAAAALGYQARAVLWLRVHPSAIRAVGHALADEPRIAFAAAISGSLQHQRRRPLPRPRRALRLHLRPDRLAARSAIPGDIARAHPGQAERNTAVRRAAPRTGGTASNGFPVIGSRPIPTGVAISMDRAKGKLGPPIEVVARALQMVGGALARRTRRTITPGFSAHDPGEA